MVGAMRFLPVLFLFAITAAPPARAQGPAYPPARREALVEKLHGVEVADPYRWMEDIDSPETRTWVEAQAKLAEDYLSKLPKREFFRRRLEQLQDYDHPGLPQLVAGRIFQSRRTGLQNQAVLYWKEDKPEAQPTVLLDPNTLRADGTMALGGYDVSDDGKMLAYCLSEAGSDWTTVHVREVDGGKDRPDLIRWVKSGGVSWSHDGRGFYYSRFPQPAPGQELKAENINQKVYFHILGQSQDQDRLVYERPDQPRWGFSAGETEDGRFLLIHVHQGTKPENNLLYRDLSAGADAPVVELHGGFKAEWHFLGNAGERWFFLTTENAPNRKVVAIDIRRPTERQEIIPAGPAPLASANLVGHRLVVQRMVDVHDEVTVHELDGSRIGTIPLPNFGSVGGFGGRSDDKETFYMVSGFDTPGKIFRYALGEGRSTLFEETRVPFETTKIVVEQLWFSSKDGTRIPLYLIRGRDTTRTGDKPVLLNGYGGFNISLLPYFQASRIAWIEAGGVVAQVALRGGGEFGQAWHEAGMRAKKQNVFDDFIGAAEFLVRDGWTKPARLAISGASNGGLLVGACLVQRPDLFGCALPGVGVMDMLRFHKFTVGWGWQEEYGYPDKAEDFPTLLAYSPLHQVKPGTKYPATLIHTGDHDDRVFPAHSFKFAAALQQAQAGPAPVLLRVELRAGHGAGKPTSKQIGETADLFAFAWQALGMD